MKTTCKVGTAEWDGDLPQLLRRLRDFSFEGNEAGYALATLDDLLTGDLNDPSHVFAHMYGLDDALEAATGLLGTPESQQVIRTYMDCTIRSGAPPFVVSFQDRLISIVPLFVSGSSTIFILLWVPHGELSPFGWTRVFQEEEASGNRMGRAETLSARELEVTRWIGEGKTSFEIARILDISEHTVNDYIRSSMQKLKCANRMHLISKTIRLGLLA